jgi:hypothetical protein
MVGPLAHIPEENRFYIGEIVYHGEGLELGH